MFALLLGACLSAEPPPIAIDALAVGETVSAFGYGRDPGVDALGLLTLTVELDFEALAGWPGGSALVTGQGTLGGAPSSDRIGDLQFVSNIEAPDAVTLYEAWLQQRIGPVSLRAGILALDTEFLLLPSTLLFVHSSPATPATFGASGVNGPSIFPVTALGVRANGVLAEGIMLRAAVLEGVPGDPGRPRAFDVTLESNEGALAVAEFAVDSEAGFAFRGGAYGYTTRVEGAGRGPAGGYAMAEQSIDHLTVFAQLDVADGSKTPIAQYLGGGAAYAFEGLLDRSRKDRVGLALMSARFGERARQNGRRGWETAVELTYALVLGEWLTLQPDLQWVHNPGGRAENASAWVGIFRMTVSPPTVVPL